MLIYIFWILIFFLSAIYYYYFYSKPKNKPSYKRTVIHRNYNYKTDSFNTQNGKKECSIYDHNSNRLNLFRKYCFD